jgi:hypothetical protein
MITFSLLLLAINLWIVSIVYRAEKVLAREFDKTRSWAHNFGMRFVNDCNNRIDVFGKKAEKELRGKADKVLIDSAVATKMADRAFNMASSANLGVVALQKALATPRLINRGQAKLNELAKNSVDELFTTQGEYDWLKPLLSDSDLDLLEEIEQKKLKDQMKS